MIAKAKSISHGINDIRYITGESRNKKHPERIYHVKDNLLPPGLDATGIWDSMRLTLAKSRRVKNSVIRIEVSPAPEHTKDFTIDDWRKLWDDFIDEFDNIELCDKNGRTYSPKTNLRGSKGSIWLHEESESGVPHLHGAFCRIDGQGRVNNDHDIHLRAQRAAERVALKRGWTTAAEVRDTNIGQVNRDCMEALQSLESWSWDGYAAILRSKGYDLWELKDNRKVLRGYVLKKGNARYKASELGRGRNLMASRLESTWRKLHAAPGTKAVPTPPAARKPVPAAPFRAQGTAPVPRYTDYHPVPYRHRRGKPAPLHPRKGHGGVRRRVRLPRGGEPQGADKPRRVLVHRDDVRTGRTLGRRWRKYRRHALGKTRGRGRTGMGAPMRP